MTSSGAIRSNHRIYCRVVEYALRNPRVGVGRKRSNDDEVCRFPGVRGTVA